MLRSTHFKPTCMILVVGSANLNCAVRAHQISALPRRNRAGNRLQHLPQRARCQPGSGLRPGGAYSETRVFKIPGPILFSKVRYLDSRA